MPCVGRTAKKSVWFPTVNNAMGLETGMQREKEIVIALMGNPNVGKSTVFNQLTGLRQHTGNWPGKTVSVAQGQYRYKGRTYEMVDLPGTYSLLSQSREEIEAVEYLSSGQPDCVVIVADATCLERCLNLALQVMQLHPKPVLCVNLMDEASRYGIEVQLDALERELGIPVVATSATAGEGLEQLKETLRNLHDGFLPLHCRKLPFSLEDNSWNQGASDSVSQVFSRQAHEIAQKAVAGQRSNVISRWDRIVLGRWSGGMCMMGLLVLVFWLTIQGANFPSSMLQKGFDWILRWLRTWMSGAPPWISGLLLDGIYTTSARVISVMLPPMAIFFPLFTLLEDLGYLPRAAFYMDHSFERCGSCGKQMLTMTMGFGCNAAGVMGCRIISSPKERLLAILTNSFVPCNGKFPALMVLITIFFSDHALIGAVMLSGFVLLGTLVTLGTTKMLSHCVLREQESRFILEIPPYRRPQLRKVLLRAFWDRTLFVLGRAAAVAAPAGGILWCLQNLTWGGAPFLQTLCQWLEPAGKLFGMSGTIILAFILSFPANELLLPCLSMLLLGGSSMTDLSTKALGELLLGAGWNWKTALCTAIFLLFHWPCSTTCLTIAKETGSIKWTAVAVILPTLVGLLLTGLVSGL